MQTNQHKRPQNNNIRKCCNDEHDNTQSGHKTNNIRSAAEVWVGSQCTPHYTAVDTKNNIQQTTKQYIPYKQNNPPTNNISMHI